MAQTHKTAQISSQAEIAEDVTIGAYSIIGADAVIGARSRIAPHVVIHGNTHIGQNNQIFQFASVGDIPQDKKYREGEKTFLKIGDNNSIREFCSINAGTTPGTSIGDSNLLMAYVHIAHDCVIGNGTIFVNNATLGGHVQVDDYAVVGAAVKVHQFCRIGEYAFSRDTTLTLDVPPYLMAASHPARIYGVNIIGLKRAEFSHELISVLKKCHKKLVRREGWKENAVKELAGYAEQYSEVRKFIRFIEDSKRGILRSGKSPK